MPVGVHCPSHLLMTNDELLCRCCTCSMLHHSTVSSIHFSQVFLACLFLPQLQTELTSSVYIMHSIHVPEVQLPSNQGLKDFSFYPMPFFTSISVIFLALSFKPLCLLITTNNAQFLSYKFYDIFALSLN